MATNNKNPFPPKNLKGSAKAVYKVTPSFQDDREVSGPSYGFVSVPKLHSLPSSRAPPSLLFIRSYYKKGFP